MGIGDWQSHAAQTFMQGRILKLNNYWEGDRLILEICNGIDDWDLWDDAFPNRKLREVLRKDWKKYYYNSVKGRKREATKGDIRDTVERYVTQPLQRMFDRADLTINFDAGGWFGRQAPSWDHYEAMWSRLKDDTALAGYKVKSMNLPSTRAKADRWALYGQFGKAEAQAAGLKLPHVKKDAATGRFFHSPTKDAFVEAQIFAALNYKERKHGSNIEYGKSHMVLHPDYKRDALFFPMDTFLPMVSPSGDAKDKTQRAQVDQISARTFGGAILCAVVALARRNPGVENYCRILFRDLLEAANRRNMGADTKDSGQMVEAHILRKVRLDGLCVKRMVICKDEVTTAAARANIQSFHASSGIPCTIID